MALKGIVSKRAIIGLPARPGAPSWVKVKCTHREDFLVIGFTEPGGGRLGFGSLALGYYDAAGTLHCAGKVGTGFDGKALIDIRRRLNDLPASPRLCASLPAGIPARSVHWVEPRLVAEVLRGMDPRRLAAASDPPAVRDDKAADDVVRASVGGARPST